MATRRKQAVNAADVEPIATQQLIPSVKTWLTQYGQEVNEERSIPDFRDGLKPVHRRSLWAMQQVVTSQNRLIKSARVVGNTIGQLHPHGDTACLRGNTLVPLLSGTHVTIKELADKKSGPKWVLSYDEETKSLVPALAHSWRKAKVSCHMLRVHVSSGEVLEVTPEHKLISKTLGWMEAKDLTIGDIVVGGNWQQSETELPTTDDASCIVERLEYVTLEAKETFYDFTVDNYENMIVFSSNGKKSGNFLAVHNCYNAIVTLATSFAPVIQGEGNWGTQIDSAAAYRYTNCNLTELGKLNFHPYFLPCADLIPNFDGSSKEPLVLPALLPQLLFNGSSGIGVGVTTSIPSFEPASVLKTMIRLLNGEQLTPDDYAKSLKFQEVYGGQPIKSKENAEAIRAFFEGHKGYVDWNSEIEIDRDRKTITILAFAPGISPLNFLENKVKPRDEVQNVSAGDAGMSFVIRCKKTLNYNDFDKFVNFLKKGLTCRNHYEVYVTERLLDEGSDDKYHVNFFAISIPNLIVRWLKWRCKLEARSLDFRIEKTQGQIAFTELMILACDNLQIIMDALRREDTADYIAKKLKISIEQANVILDRKVRNLSKLDNSKLRLRVKELKSLLANLKTKRKKPSAEVKTFFESTLDQFKLAEKWIGTRQYRLQAGTANRVYADPLLDSQASEVEAAP